MASHIHLQLKTLASDAEREWQSRERVFMCADWVVESLLNPESGFKGHEKRLAEQLREALEAARNDQ